MFIIGSIIILTIIVTLGVSWLARGIIFENIAHDSYKQVNTATHFSNWGGWPSGMHKFGGGKALMKDAGVLLLVVMQRLFNDKKGFYPLFIVSNFANAVSAVFVFLVAQSYWGSNIGFCLFILYFFCFWPFQIVFVGGLQVVAQMFFLLSIYVLQQTEPILSLSNISLFTLSGFLFGLMNFASASGRKFIPVYLAALVYYSSGSHAVPWIFYKAEYNAYNGSMVSIGLILILMAGLALIFLSYKKITRLIYEDRLSFIKFRSKDKHDIEYYYMYWRKVFQNVPLPFCFVLLFLIIVLAYLPQDESYVFLGTAILGTISLIFLLMAPNLMTNLISYLIYWKAESVSSKYYLHENYFKRKYGKVFKKGKEGWIWYIKFYWRMIPFHMFLYCMAITMIAYGTITSPVEEMIGLVLLAAISVMPILWGEITTGPKASLAMYTSFIPLFLPIGYLMNQLQVNGLIFIGINFNVLVWIFLAISSAWNCYIFFTDTLPCRMAVTRIMKKLDKYNIKKFFTYDTIFNEQFAGVIKDFFPEKYDIQYISSINEIKSGYLLVPCTNAKAVYYHATAEIGQHDNFNADETLNSIIETREIQKISFASFKTMGNSKYWQHLGNVTSFRDLILKEVSDEDRFHGYAWLLDVEKKL